MEEMVSTYRISATLQIAVSQDGRRPVDVNTARRQLAAVLRKAVNDLLLADVELRDHLWRAAGGGDDVDGHMSFSVVDVQPE